MLILGHTGITLGAAILLHRFFSQTYRQTPDNVGGSDFAPDSNRHMAQNSQCRHRASRVVSLADHIDVRLLLIGSLLPDIIDKPVGMILFRDSLSNGRMFCHTLIFLLAITLAGFYLYRSHEKIWLVILAFGTLTHLILDRMWLAYQTLLWPLYGFGFETVDLTSWFRNILYSLLTDPWVYVSEFVGAAILAWFVLVMVHRGRPSVFLKKR